MKSRTYSGFLSGIAAISCISAVTVGYAPTALAAPNAPSDPLCTITYPTPDDFSVQATSDAFATSVTSGSMELKLHTDSRSQTGYDQKFAVTWANITTGRNGQADASAFVKGSDNTLSIPGTVTKAGRIALVLSVTNHGTGDNYTYGDCSVEYTVP
ncbi:hypothetical protein [Nocardia sp. NPDC057440]|uniref:hypothetical protein n=1 Tax=Nocardia sp. NPDC057440 TaxID=3346134 RepID=UPI00366B34D0